MHPKGKGGRERERVQSYLIGPTQKIKIKPQIKYVVIISMPLNPKPKR
jgi:hypothetical protein